jgi:hypothetical protein
LPILRCTEEEEEEEETSVWISVLLGGLKKETLINKRKNGLKKHTQKDKKERF